MQRSGHVTVSVATVEARGPSTLFTGSVFMVQREVGKGQREKKLWPL